MLIVLNGYPGVGKLTIGRELAELTGGRLLDVHTVFNLAFALTDVWSEAFYETVRAVWRIADERILALLAGVPVIFTEVNTEITSEWADECWARVRRLAEARGPLMVVHVLCELEENKRRIQFPGPELARKPRDPAMAERNHTGGARLSGSDATNLLRLDVTSMAAAEAARVIQGWLEGSLVRHS